MLYILFLQATSFQKVNNHRNGIIANFAKDFDEHKSQTEGGELEILRNFSPI